MARHRRHTVPYPGVPSPIQVQQRHGIYLPEADLWLDPKHRVDAAFISHAHADHADKHQLIFCSEVTRALMYDHLGVTGQHRFRVLPFGEPVRWGEWELLLLPAGHIMGSAMLHLTRLSDGETLLYTGDFKLRPGLAAEPCQLRQADTLIMEATFGAKKFVLPCMADVVPEIHAFVNETIAREQVPVLFGLALGAAQDLLCSLAGITHPIMVHEQVLTLSKHLPKAPPHSLFSWRRAQGHVVIMPPSERDSPLLAKLPCRFATFSAFTLIPGARIKPAVDVAFPGTDHADYIDLVTTVEAVKPKQVWLVHGYVKPLAEDLRRLGYNARALVSQSNVERRSAPTVKLLAPESFERWAQGCAKKDEREAYLASLSATDRALAELFFAGRAGEVPPGIDSLCTGWNTLKKALQDLSGLNDHQFRQLERQTQVYGELAELALRRAPLVPEPVTLAETSAFFDQMRIPQSRPDRQALLVKHLRKLSAAAGAMLVRLMFATLP